MNIDGQMKVPRDRDSIDNRFSNKGRMGKVNGIHGRVEKLKQKIEELGLKYRDQGLRKGDLVSISNEIIEEINQTSDYCREVAQLLVNVDLSEGDKQLLFNKIEGIKKGLIEMEKQYEQQMRLELSHSLLNWSGQKEPEAVSIRENLKVLQGTRLSKNQIDSVMSFVNRFVSLNQYSHKPKEIGAVRLSQQKSFTKEEIEELDRTISFLQTYATDSVEEKRAIDQFIKELESGRKAIKEAIEYRVKLFKGIDVKTLTGTIQNLGTKIHAKPRNDLKEIERLMFTKLATLYWGFYPPFGIQISISDFMEIQADQSLANKGALRKFEASLQSLISLDTYSLLSQTELKEFQCATFQRLKRMREYNLSGSNPNVTIVGGGPGGLTRGLIAAVSGANWEVIEKRDIKFGRKNVIKIEDSNVLKLLLFFGVTESLLMSDAPPFSYHERIGHSLILSIGRLEEALAVSLSHLSDERGKVVAGEVVDVRTGGAVRTEVVLKGQEHPREADMIVFADGARSAGAKIVAEREAFSTPTMMFGISLENCKKNASKMKKSIPYVPPAGGIPFDFLVISGTSGKNSYATVVVREDFAESIRKKENEIEGISDEELKKRAKEEMQKWFNESCLHYMNWLGYEGGKVQLARPFEVVISKAVYAAVTQGNTLILSSGDAYATPDPAASIGTGMAIRSGLQFFDAIRSWKDKKELGAIREEQNYAMDVIYEPFIELSFKERDRYAGKETMSVIALLRQVEQKGDLSKEMVSGLIFAFQKYNVGAAYTKEDIKWLKEAFELTKRGPFEKPSTWKEYEAHRTEKWKDWLHAKIQELLIQN